MYSFLPAHVLVRLAAEQASHWCWSPPECSCCLFSSCSCSAVTKSPVAACKRDFGASQLHLNAFHFLSSPLIKSMILTNGLCPRSLRKSRVCGREAVGSLRFYHYFCSFFFSSPLRCCVTNSKFGLGLLGILWASGRVVARLGLVKWD